MSNADMTDAKNISIKIPKSLLQELSILQAEMSVSRDQVIENALTSYLKLVHRKRTSFNEEEEIDKLKQTQDELRLDIGRLSSICDELMNRLVAVENA